MNIQEWMKAYEFKDIWNCMLTNWPNTSGQKELYQDIFCALKSVHIPTDLEPQLLYLGLNAEGEIENRIQCKDIYSPTRSMYGTDIWELASLIVSRNMQDKTAHYESDIEFASAILYYVGDMLLISSPYKVPVLTNPYSTLADKLVSEVNNANNSSRHLRRGLATSAETIKTNWDLWYSVCSDLTFGSKREAMEFKEYFLHAHNLMQLEVSFNPNNTKDVVSSIETIEEWLNGRTIDRLMMFIYAHPLNNTSVNI